MLTWYLPSLFGDIRLKSNSSNQTEVTICGLSPQEKIAVGVLLKRAVKGTVVQSPWATSEALSQLDLDRLGEQSFTLRASIVDVQKVLSKPLKPMRKQVSVVRFANGKIEEITESTIGLVLAAVDETPKTEVITPNRAKAAVTVAQPVIGCPEPDFDEAEVRATHVLEQFLSTEQLEDFRTYQQFIVTGADSGHRYMLTSRHAPKSRFPERELEAGSGVRFHSTQSVFDLDENRPLCVHDWEVPAAEELLGLTIHMQIPGLERYVRDLPAHD